MGFSTLDPMADTERRLLQVLSVRIEGFSTLDPMARMKKMTGASTLPVT